MDESFLVDASELELRLAHPPGERKLSFVNWDGPFEQWRRRCRSKLAELIGLAEPGPADVRELRRTTRGDVDVRLLLMAAAEGLELPAYLLTPAEDRRAGSAVMAIHGHSPGRCEGPLGLSDDGYNGFAMRLAEAGFVVLLPVHRGFGPLRDLAAGRDDLRLDYEQSMHFSYVTDCFVRGRTVVGENVADLLRWEEFLARELAIEAVYAAGLSYGGDLALTYPLFSRRVERIFASGSCASFEDHFARCYNGPAHCVPGILTWMDRSDIAGLNAPRPLVLHFGELDTPSLDPDRPNYAAARTQHTDRLGAETREIYAAAGAPGNVELVLTAGMAHAFDVGACLALLEGA